MLSAIWAARYRMPARFVALVALLLPWTTTGVIFALIPWLIAFAFVDLRELPRSLLRPVCLLPMRWWFSHLSGRSGRMQRGRRGCTDWDHR